MSCREAHAIKLPVPLLSLFCHYSQEEEGPPRNQRVLQRRTTTGRGHRQSMHPENFQGHGGAASILDQLKIACRRTFVRLAIHLLIIPVLQQHGKSPRSRFNMGDGWKKVMMMPSSVERFRTHGLQVRLG